MTKETQNNELRTIMLIELVALLTPAEQDKIIAEIKAILSER